MSHLVLFLFGPPRLELNHQPIKLNRHKAMALLAYLVMTELPHSRNTLASLLWPNQDQQRARAALRRILVTLNKAGLGAWLDIDRETISLKDEAEDNLWCDVVEFRSRLGACLTAEKDADTVCIPLLTEAIQLYKADFMEGFSLRDSSNFEEWQLFQTENLRYDLISALDRLIRCYIKQGEFEPAIAHARHWLTIDPLYELAHRQLMQLYAWNGQRTAALRQYQECVRILKQELNVAPSEETTTLYKQIQRGTISPKGKSLSLKPTQHPTTSLYNFPTQPTPFLGRQKELSEIAKRLQNSDCHLLTLVGPGGIGKTRLAIQAAIKHDMTFIDGLYFIPLAPVSSQDFLLPTIVDSLQLPLDGQQDALPQLINYLRDKKILLVMDNFEHLIKKAHVLTEILKQAPKTKILVTSRERLNLHGEWIFPVKGMSYPSDSTMRDIEGYGAVALFLHRAYRVHPDFSLTEADKPHIVHICHLMEGMPLGIELAATWTRMLSCQEIAIEIERMYDNATPSNFDFLNVSLRDAPERHRSLAGVFEHSWQLLSPKEQDIFKKLSVFQGGASREAIEQITGATLTQISALIDKSLLTRSMSGRYEMHQLSRQYASEKLWQVPSEAKAIQDRFCQYYTTFLQQREKRLKGTAQKNTLIEIGKEIENVRASWRWAVAQHKITEIEQAMDTLWYFYAMYGWFTEGVEAFGRAMMTVKEDEKLEPDPTLTARILAYLGWFFLRQGLYAQAEDLLQQSITIFREAEDQKNIAVSLHYLGILYGETGKHLKAKQLLQESLTIYRKTTNQWGIAWSLSDLAYHTSELDEGHQLKTKQLLQESLTIYQAIGNKQGIASALNNLGYIAYRAKDYPKAKQLLEESLALRREVGYPREIAVSLNNLGHITGAMADYQSCKIYYYESLKIAVDINAIPLTLAALGGLAVPFVHEDKVELALELLNLVLHHPASNNETRDRANCFLAQLKTDLLPEKFVNFHISAKPPRKLKLIVTEILKAGKNIS